jgi:hypothetical protein
VLDLLRDAFGDSASLRNTVRAVDQLCGVNQVVLVARGLRFGRRLR